MPGRSHSLVSALGGLVALAALLAGCATTSGGTTPTPEPTTTVAPDPDLGAAWLDDGRMIGLVTLGSSSCPPIADTTEFFDGVLQVELALPDGDQPCTADLAPRVTLVGVPEGVDPAEALPIQVTGEDYVGEVELAGVEGLAGPGGSTDYLPSAGWATVPGQFVILTWGSSTCVPVIEDVAATGAAEVTVTFQTPPEDQACTMDMAPRAAVAYIDGLEEDSGVEAVLTGSPEFPDVRVPIYGSNAS